MKHAGKTRGRKLAERLVTAVTVVAACVALTAGGTLAYFSASETAHNVITTGGVGIELDEWALDEAGSRVEFTDVDGVMPGETVSKIVEVRSTDTAPAWVRAKVTLSATLADGTVLAADDLAGAVSIDYDESSWKFEDGWWYCKDVLPGNGVTEPLFEGVSFSAEGMGDAYQDCSVTVEVVAQAVQSANNGESALEAAGWPAE